MSEQKANSGILKMLEFKSNADGSAENPENGQDVFRVMINPDTISHTVRLLTTENDGTNNSYTYSCDSETISFTFYLDGTNVVPLPQNYEGKGKSVSDLVKEFLKTVYNKNVLEDKEKPNKPKPVEAIYIEYGDLHWTARTNSITIDHTLFDRSGNTLRAKVTCTFETLKNNNSDQNNNEMSSTSITPAKNDNLCDCTQMCAAARNNNQDSLYTPADANFSTIDGREIKV